MSTAIHPNRKWLIVVVVILIAVTISIIYLAGRSTPNIKRSQVGSRYPISALTYCSLDQSHLCVLSFGQIVNGPMRVDFLAPEADYPEFVLHVLNSGVENTYECQTSEDSPENVYCTGNVQSPGAILQLSLFSKSDNALLAKGTFTIIGVALLTPAFDAGPTQKSGNEFSSQLGFRTPEAPRRSPLPLHPLPTTPSYPNPSYP